jgi:Protein of unknown function (DUF3176)
MDNQQSQVFLIHEDGSISMRPPWLSDQPFVGGVDDFLNNDRSSLDFQPIQAQNSQCLIPPKPPMNSTISERGTTDCGEHISESCRLTEKRRARVTTHISIFKILHDWWLEALSFLLVLSLLLVMIATIYPHQGCLLPQWPYSISINSLLSVYVLMLKGAMLLITAEGLSQLKWAWYRQARPLADLQTYDMVSRGPLGSLRLLWYFHKGHITSSTGACITIAALIIDPFTQQVIRYKTCWAPRLGSQAFIPRTNIFNEQYSYRSAGMSMVTDGMQAAIIAGIFHSNAVNIPVHCVTGNCTFLTQYQSVGYCSKCTDITDQLIVSNAKFYDQDQPKNSNCSRSSLRVKTSLPSGLYTNHHQMPCVEDCDTTLFAMSSWFSTKIQTILGSTKYIDHEKKDCSDPKMKESWSCSNLSYGAAECELYPCVRSYSANVTGGRLMESVISEYKFKEEPDYWSAIYVDCLPEPDRQSLISTGYIIDRDMPWIQYNMSLDDYNRTIKEDNTTLSAPHEYIYAADFSSERALYVYMQGLLNNSIYELDLGEPGVNVMQAFYKYGAVNFNTVDAMFKKISQSITVYIRQTGFLPFNAPATGQVFHQETCVEVNWPWLTLPAALVLLTTFFFSAMVFETRRGGRPTHNWKSSPLPLLFHGLEAETLDRHGYGEIYDLGEMERSAKGLHVRLEPTQKGWRLTEVETVHAEDSRPCTRHFFKFKSGRQVPAS